MNSPGATRGYVGTGSHPTPPGGDPERILESSNQGIVSLSLLQIDAKSTRDLTLDGSKQAKTSWFSRRVGILP